MWWAQFFWAGTLHRVYTYKLKGQFTDALTQRVVFFVYPHNESKLSLLETIYLHIPRSFLRTKLTSKYISNVFVPVGIYAKYGIRGQFEMVEDTS